MRTPIAILCAGLVALTACTSGPAPGRTTPSRPPAGDTVAAAPADPTRSQALYLAPAGFPWRPRASGWATATWRGWSPVAQLSSVRDAAWC